MFYRGVGERRGNSVEISCRVGDAEFVGRDMCMRRGKSVRLNELPRDAESFESQRAPSTVSRTISQETAPPVWGVLNAQNVRDISFLRIRGIEPLWH